MKMFKKHINMFKYDIFLQSLDKTVPDDLLGRYIFRPASAEMTLQKRRGTQRKGRRVPRYLCSLFIM